MFKQGALSASSISAVELPAALKAVAGKTGQRHWLQAEWAKEEAGQTTNWDLKDIHHHRVGAWKK